MALIVEAVYKNGVLKPKKRLRIPEGSKVRLTVRPMDQAEDFLAGVVGIGKSGRADGAQNHDKYLYKKGRS